MRWGIGVLAAALLLSGCATTVTGAAKPVPGQGPVLPGNADPCSLISAEQAAQLKLEHPPKLRPASKAEGIHSYCSWEPGDQAYSLVSLSAVWSLDESISNYMGGALAKETFQVGGLTWTRYPAPGGDGTCLIATPLGPQSFLAVDASTLDEARADPCAYPKAAVLAIAAHLPGGAPAPPTLTPPTRPAAPPGPLVGLDACAMLTPEQATGLALVAAGEPRKPPSNDPITGCQWADTDGPGKQGGFVVWLGPAKPAKDWLDAEGEPVEAGGREWKLISNVGNSRRLCTATLAVTETSSVSISSGYDDDLDRMCDLVKAAMPLVAGHIPA